MKKCFLSILCFTMMAVSLSAQKLPKSVKDAKKALNASKFEEALTLINAALEDESVANIAEAWAVKGSIYNGLLSNDFSEYLKASTLQQEYVIKNPDAGPEALAAYKNALEKSVDDKDKGKKEAIKGLVSVATSLNQIGISLYNEKKFDKAFESFASIVEARDLLIAIGNKSILSDEKDYHQVMYYAGLSAASNGTPEKANKIFETLVDADFKESLPYEMLFDNLVESKPEEAIAVLEKGKKNCAGTEGSMKKFLIKEINYYLQKGEKDKLESRLQDAIEQDPTNHSLYHVLGTVYADLANNSTGATADEYTTKAASFYTKTLELKPDFARASFDNGVLYHTKGVMLNEPLKELGNDFSSAGEKKYNELKATQKAYLEQSVPYFERAVEIDPNYLDALNALKSIAAYLGDEAMITKYTKLIEAVEK